MQFQSDILNVPVDRPVVNETTALGAAYLAGLAVGFWKSKDEIAAQWQIDKSFIPSFTEAQIKSNYKGWQTAVNATMAFKPNK